MAEIEKRPNRLTPEMSMAVARKLATDLQRQGLIEKDENPESYAADLAKWGRTHQDGYELAKLLDDRCYWGCNLQMAEELDNFGHYARSEIEAAEKAWAERNKIAPPFPVGTRIEFDNGFHGRRTGEITEVYKYGTAKYLIKVDGDPDAEKRQSRSIVNFEDVRSLAEVANTEILT